jgi:hypothetical protein
MGWPVATLLVLALLVAAVVRAVEAGGGAGECLDNDQTCQSSPRRVSSLPRPRPPSAPRPVPPIPVSTWEAPPLPTDWHPHELPLLRPLSSDGSSSTELAYRVYGSELDSINGVYVPTADWHNGFPVYMNQGQAAVLYFYDREDVPKGTW